MSRTRVSEDSVSTVMIKVTQRDEMPSGSNALAALAVNPTPLHLSPDCITLIWHESLAKVLKRSEVL